MIILGLIRGVARILHWQGTEAERRRRENRGAKEVRIWEGIPLRKRLGDLGEHCELPQRGPGRSQGRQRIFGIFEAHGTLLVQRTVLLRPNKASFPVKNPLNRRLGAWPPCLPPLAAPLGLISMITPT